MTIGSVLLAAVVAITSAATSATVTASSTTSVTETAPPHVRTATAVRAPVPVPVDRRLEGPAEAAPPATPPSGSRWAWPLEPRPPVERRFAPPAQPWLPGHRGVDLAAASGQPVHSPAAGTVTFAGQLAGREVLVVAHAGGLRSTFEPVHGSVAVGASVERGQVVGVVTSTPGHCAPSACLHWGVRRGDTYLDPLAFVGRARIVLLPL